jgi:hypothetical protein
MLEKYNQRVLESNRFNDKNNFITLIVILFVEIICVETKQYFAYCDGKIKTIAFILHHTTNIYFYISKKIRALASGVPFNFVI